MLKKALVRLLVNRGLLLLIIAGSISWSATMVKSGRMLPSGIGFWGANGHDGVWHIALANSLARGSMEMPVFAGETLKNYHIGYDLFLAVLTGLTTISVSTWYFQILPPFTALAVGLLTYMLVSGWKSHREALWSVFFVYFGGSLGWLILLFREGALGGESMFWSQQAINTLINPPFALSLVFILFGLLLLQKYFKTKVKYYLLLATIIFGLLIQIKAYAGVLALGGLLSAGLYDYVRDRKANILTVAVSAALVSGMIFIPLNRSSGNLFVFQPFWFLETMMGLTDRLGWVRYGEAMVNWRAGGAVPKSFAAYGIAFIIFLVGNMGTRIFSIFPMVKAIRKPMQAHWLDVFFLVVFAGGVFIPMFFLQAGTPWNTIQFFYYCLFVAGIWAGIAMPSFINRYGKPVAILTVILTLPTTLITLAVDYLPPRPPAVLPPDEYAALTFLSHEPEGIVLTFPFDPDLVETVAPVPLYRYTSTAYVSAYSGKPVFLEDEVNLDITQYPWRERKDEVLAFYKDPNQESAREYLKKNNISYIYWVKPADPLLRQRAHLGETQLGIERLYENDSVDIYKVRN